MKWFILPAGIWILIDEIDIPIIQSCGWRLNDWGYIMGTSRNSPYRDKCLHCIIAERMGLNLSNFIDHRDRSKINNQRSNLREATHSQNRMNSKIRTDNISGYTGIVWNEEHQKWMVRIQVNGKRIFLGLFDNLEEAVQIRKEAADQYHGEFARHD